MEWSWLAWFAGFIVLINVIRYITVFQAVSRLRCRLPSIVYFPAEDMPSEVEPLLSLADQELAGLGFQFSTFVALRASVHQSEADTPVYGKLFVHPLHQVSALVQLESLWQLNNPLRVNFISFCKDNTIIETTRMLVGDWLPFPEFVGLSAAQTHHIEEQYEFHLKRLGEIQQDKLLELQSSEILINLLQKYLQRLNEFWLEQGLMVPQAGDETRIRLSWKSTVILTRSLMSLMVEAKQKAQSLSKVPKDILPLWNSFIVKNLLDERESNGGWLGKFVLFVGSALVFAVIFGFAFSWEFVPILVGVILLHELGHFYAMKWTGYKDLQIFFVPMLGAAATGKKQDASPLQQLFVYLMGPMPGLILSVPILWLGYTHNNSLLLGIGGVSFIINYLNLLPITPLDGGRVLDTLLFSRFPRAQFIFSLLSAMLMAAGGIALSDPILIGVGVLLLLSLPSSWNLSLMNRALASVRRQRPNLNDPLLLTTGALESLEVNSVPREAKFQCVRQLYHSAQIRHASVRVAIGGMIVYLCCLFSPLLMGTAVVIYSFFEGDPEMLGAFLEQRFEPQVTVENWRELLDESKYDSSKYRILSSAYYLFEGGNTQTASEIIEHMLELGWLEQTDKDNDETRILFSSLRTLQYGQLDYTYKLNTLNQIIQRWEKAERSEAGLAQLYQIKAETLSDNSEKITFFKKSIALFESSLGTSHYSTASARSGLAYAHYRLGNLKQVEKILDQNMQTEPESDYLPYSGIEMLHFQIVTGDEVKVMSIVETLNHQLDVLSPEERQYGEQDVHSSLLFYHCSKGHRDRCLAMVNETVAYWEKRKNTEFPLASDQNAYFARVSAYHLLGEPVSAMQWAQELLSRYPELINDNLESSELLEAGLEDKVNEKKYSEYGWGAPFIKLEDDIWRKYKISPYYD